jgi:hypothetical protein
MSKLSELSQREPARASVIVLDLSLIASDYADFIPEQHEKVRKLVRN